MFQRTVLNGLTAEWLPVKAGIPQWSILGPLLFLIYINDQSIDIISTVKLFADHTSLFPIIHDVKTTAYELNKDLQETAEWSHQWKMSFNPDFNKQAQEVIFHRKLLNHLTHKSFSAIWLFLVQVFKSIQEFI